MASGQVQPSLLAGDPGGITAMQDQQVVASLVDGDLKISRALLARLSGLAKAWFQPRFASFTAQDGAHLMMWI